MEHFSHDLKTDHALTYQSANDTETDNFRGYPEA